MQIAITLPDEVVDDLDHLVPDQFASRAEVVRAAVQAFLSHRRASAIDAAFRAGYDATPPKVDEIDIGRVTRTSQPAAWDKLAW